MRNTRRNQVYKFNLINFVKPASLYNEGMQPLMYSTKGSAGAAAAAASAAGGAGGTGGAGGEDSDPFDLRPPTAASIAGTAALKASGPIGWFRGGANIAYYENQLARGSSRQKNFYTLSFTTTFQHDNDTVYFAYCYPYTYTNLNKGQLTGKHPERGGGRSRA